MNKLEEIHVVIEHDTQNILLLLRLYHYVNATCLM